MDNNFNFIVKQSEEKGWWVCTETENQVLIRWKDKEFNEVQEGKIIDDAMLIDRYGSNLADALAKIMAGIGDYLSQEHREKVFDLNDRQMLGYQLEKLRRAKGLSIEELSEQTNLSPLTIFKIERGKFSPKVENLQAILRCLEAEITIK